MVRLQGDLGFVGKLANTLTAATAPRLLPTQADWVNPSKRGGMDGVFWGLTGLLRGISRGQSPSEIHEEQPCQPEENPVLPNSFNQKLHSI